MADLTLNILFDIDRLQSSLDILVEAAGRHAQACTDDDFLKQEVPVAIEETRDIIASLRRRVPHRLAGSSPAELQGFSPIRVASDRG